MDTLTRPLSRKEIEAKVLTEGKFWSRPPVEWRTVAVTPDELWDHAFDLWVSKDIDVDRLLRVLQEADTLVMRVQDRHDYTIAVKAPDREEHAFAEVFHYEPGGSPGP